MTLELVPTTCIICMVNPVIQDGYSKTCYSIDCQIRWHEANNIITGRICPKCNRPTSKKNGKCNRKGCHRS